MVILLWLTCDGERGARLSRERITVLYYCREGSLRTFPRARARVYKRRHGVEWPFFSCRVNWIRILNEIAEFSHNTDENFIRVISFLIYRLLDSELFWFVHKKPRKGQIFINEWLQLYELKKKPQQKTDKLLFVTCCKDVLQHEYSFSNR